MAQPSGDAGGDAVTPAVRDRRARPLRDLRISVTDRCNFRCGYCMPREVFGPGHAFLPRSELLSYEELGRLVRVFADLGVSKVRLTGGEPLLRRDLHVLVSLVASTPGITDVALTTNGSLLAAHAQSLRNAGLHRVTVSLDSLDPTVFAAMGDTKVPLSKVLDAIAAAAAAGLAPIKLNTVLRRAGTGVRDGAGPRTGTLQKGVLTDEISPNSPRPSLLGLPWRVANALTGRAGCCGKGLLEPGAPGAPGDGGGLPPGDLVVAEDPEELQVSEFPGAGLGQSGVEGLQHSAELERAQRRGDDQLAADHGRRRADDLGAIGPADGERGR